MIMMTWRKKEFLGVSRNSGGNPSQPCLQDRWTGLLPTLSPQAVFHSRMIRKPAKTCPRQCRLELGGAGGPAHTGCTAVPISTLIFPWLLARGLHLPAHSKHQRSRSSGLPWTYCSLPWGDGQLCLRVVFKQDGIRSWNGGWNQMSIFIRTGNCLSK